MRKSTVLLMVLLAVSGGLLVEHQAVLDWWHLRGYQASSAISQLAVNDTMTPEAQHLLYVNHPAIMSGTDFTSHCPNGGEKTVVLGCYIGNDRGIYIYSVSDSRLSGVEQVTAAHEMLHAAYRRLSSGERNKVDAMLLDYYQHGLADQRIKDTLAAYKTSEPNDVLNEMHSIFGTEVVKLPATLETYYKQYFTDRQKVAAYTASYQGEFTTRRSQVAAYDAQLKSLKQQIDTSEAALAAQSSDLSLERASLQGSTSSAQVTVFNQKVVSYNSLLVNTKDLISQYNDIVARRNTVALEEQQLQQELSASPLSASH
ncbi:MAG TPA: hypothetical protein VLG92_04285 [Candidatus Saccharimonadia bacterium]|nr:hypothetical protein [Candidatus Saccharimonadia bacterium]